MILANLKITEGFSITTANSTASIADITTSIVASKTGHVVSLMLQTLL